MDIDNLKSTWKALQTEQEPVLADEQIRKLLRGKATDSVSKIKRNILIEGSFTFLLSLFFMVNQDWFYSPYIMPYLATVMVLCLGWYAFKYYQIRKIDLHKNLKQTLEQLIKTLHQYLKLYLYGSLFLGVFAAVLPLFWKNVLSDITMSKILMVGAVTLIALPSYYFFIKWYIKNLYGNYVDELRQELQELEELDE